VRNVVSRIRTRLTPSTPRENSAPMAGIQVEGLGQLQVRLGDIELHEQDERGEERGDDATRPTARTRSSSSSGANASTSAATSGSAMVR
jgi:hypothetical protein